jgi:hypothetical protein
MKHTVVSSTVHTYDIIQLFLSSLCYFVIVIIIVLHYFISFLINLIKNFKTFLDTLVKEKLLERFFVSNYFLHERSSLATNSHAWKR